uniref:Uncharacterized protein n=1 Tax=Myoviridae sp. ctYA416 TaxID=2825125 RepID=A0A8S5UTT0_9CAUD|nr:MAG TPA: hypothetical protein [Myoviridae sp. ctYA416]
MPPSPPTRHKNGSIKLPILVYLAGVVPGLTDLGW